MRKIFLLLILSVLAFGCVAQQVQEQEAVFTSEVEEESRDEHVELIERYYEAIVNKDFDEAYSLSSQTVSQSTFESWYTYTTDITIEDATRLDNDSTEITAKLYEGPKAIIYKINFTLELVNESPVKIASSSVETLFTSYDMNAKGWVDANQKRNFTVEGKTLSLGISKPERYDILLEGTEIDYLANEKGILFWEVDEEPGSLDGDAGVYNYKTAANAKFKFFNYESKEFVNLPRIGLRDIDIEGAIPYFQYPMDVIASTSEDKIALVIATYDPDVLYDLNMYPSLNGPDPYEFANAYAFSGRKKVEDPIADYKFTGYHTYQWDSAATELFTIQAGEGCGFCRLNIIDLSTQTEFSPGLEIEMIGRSYYVSPDLEWIVMAHSGLDTEGYLFNREGSLVKQISGGETVEGEAPSRRWHFGLEYPILQNGRAIYDFN
jgi:hypothetical protein